MINVRSVANSVMHFQQSVRLVEISPDQLRQHVNKICLGGNDENEILSRKFKNQK